MYIRVKIPLKLVERKKIEDKTNKAEVFIFPFTNIIELIITTNGIQRKFIGIKKDIENLIRAYKFKKKEVVIHKLKFGERNFSMPTCDFIYLYSEDTDTSFIANERYPVFSRARHCSNACSRLLTDFFLSEGDIRWSKLKMKYKYRYKYKFDKDKITSNLFRVTNTKTKVSKSCILKEVRDTHLIFIYTEKEKTHVFSVNISSILRGDVEIEREDV